jgi:anti-anti-sigma factor
MTGLSFDSAHVGDITVVRVHDPIFFDTRDALMAALLELTEESASHIVIDLSDVPVCDSAALNMFVRVHRAATSGHGWLRLAAPQALVARVLHSTNVDRMIPVYPDIATALDTDAQR